MFEGLPSLSFVIGYTVTFFYFLVQLLIMAATLAWRLLSFAYRVVRWLVLGMWDLGVAAVAFWRRHRAAVKERRRREAGERPALQVIMGSQRTTR